MNISVRSNDEIVFKLLLIAVENQINPRIKIPVMNFGEGRHRMTLAFGIVPDQIIDFARQRVITCDRIRSFRARKTHLQRTALSG